MQILQITDLDKTKFTRPSPVNPNLEKQGVVFDTFTKFDIPSRNSVVYIMVISSAVCAIERQADRQTNCITALYVPPFQEYQDTIAIDISILGIQRIHMMPAKAKLHRQTERQTDRQQSNPKDCFDLLVPHTFYLYSAVNVQPIFTYIYQVVNLQ